MKNAPFSGTVILFSSSIQTSKLFLLHTLLLYGLQYYYVVYYNNNLDYIIVLERLFGDYCHRHGGTVCIASIAHPIQVDAKQRRTV
jgi:hypothetical protein